MKPRVQKEYRLQASHFQLKKFSLNDLGGLVHMFARIYQPDAVQLLLRTGISLNNTFFNSRTPFGFQTGLPFANQPVTVIIRYPFLDFSIMLVGVVLEDGEYEHQEIDSNAILRMRDHFMDYLGPKDSPVNPPSFNQIIGLVWDILKHSGHVDGGAISGVSGPISIFATHSVEKSKVIHPGLGGQVVEQVVHLFEEKPAPVEGPVIVNLGEQGKKIRLFPGELATYYFHPDAYEVRLECLANVPVWCDYDAEPYNVGRTRGE